MSIFSGAFKWHLKASLKHVAEGLSDEMVQEMLIQFISIERFHSYGRPFLCFWAFAAVDGCDTGCSLLDRYLVAGGCKAS